MLATEPVTMYVSPARFRGATKRSIRSASGTQELPAHFFEDPLVGPVGMLGAHAGALDLARRPLERLSDRIARALVVRRTRHATKPSRGAREDRLRDKRRQAQRKSERRRPADD